MLAVGEVPYNSGCVSNDSTRGPYVSGAGTVMATVGTGGIALRDIDMDDTDRPYYRAVFGSNENPTHGHLELAITADNLAAEFIPTVDAHPGDAFSISKDGPAPVPAVTDLESVGSSEDFVDLAWVWAGAEPIAGFEIDRGGAPLVMLDAAERSYRDLSVVPGGSYSYGVTAVADDGRRSPRVTTSVSLPIPPGPGTPSVWWWRGRRGCGGTPRRRFRLSGVRWASTIRGGLAGSRRWGSGRRWWVPISRWGCRLRDR